MEFTPLGINLYTFFNLPSAWWCGVRVKKITRKFCSTKVNLNWINKNNKFKKESWEFNITAKRIISWLSNHQLSYNESDKEYDTIEESSYVM